MSRITLVASDMDGTLLTSNKQISAESIAVINQLNEKNIRFAISTGRCYAEIESFLPLFSFPIPIIAINGGVVYDECGTRIQSNPFATEELKKIVDILNGLDVYFELAAENHFYSHSKPRREQFITKILQTLPPIKEKRGGYKAHYCQYDEELLNSATIYKFRVFALDSDDLNVVKTEVLRKVPCEVTASASFNIEINPLGISKGKGIETLCRHYNLKTSEVLAFGDNLNDLSMIETAGYFCAMANSHPLIIEKASHVTENNDEHGVAQAILEIID